MGQQEEEQEQSGGMVMIKNKIIKLINSRLTISMYLLYCCRLNAKHSRPRP